MTRRCDNHLVPFRGRRASQRHSHGDRLCEREENATALAGGQKIAKKIFISYSQSQSEWVKEHLVPCLAAGGAEILIDYREFNAGKRVIGQMDATQDRADLHILLLSPDYMESKYCQHEMKRAIAADPQFQQGTVVPVIREACELPQVLQDFDPPLYIHLENDLNAGQWEFLLKACKVNLGTTVPEWLKARNEIVRYLSRKESVNLVVLGRKIKWRELLSHIQGDYFKDMGKIDLQSGAAASRRGFVEKILKACGIQETVPPEPEDLVFLEQKLLLKAYSRLMLTHFDMIRHRQHYQDHGKIELFAALRYLIMEKRKLAIMIQSREYFLSLLPITHPFSSLTSLKTVELKGK